MHLLKSYKLSCSISIDSMNTLNIVIFFAIILASVSAFEWIRSHLPVDFVPVRCINESSYDTILIGHGGICSKEINRHNNFGVSLEEPCLSIYRKPLPFSRSVKHVYTCTILSRAVIVYSRWNFYMAQSTTGR